jgi:NADH dehydrogenase
MQIRRSPFLRANQKLVVIIGAGFAGLNAAKKLANNENVHVILVDQKNHHLFQPLLYQVATAGLNPSDIAVPIRSQFSDASNVEVHMGRIDSVDFEQKFIRAGEIEFEYDYLILACGSQHHYFGQNEWETFAPGLKTVEQATEIRRRILLAFEQAENELDDEKRKALLTFVIVGAGPTGVELAGAISDISRTVLVKDFKRIDPTRARIILLEAGPRVLAQFDEKLSKQALKDLKKLEVEVMLNSKVEKIDGNGVQVGTQVIQAKTVFWAAGVQASPLNISPDVEKDKAGRVIVEADFSVPGFHHSFVIGDMASYEYAEKMNLPGLAPVAIQSGQFVGQLIAAEVENKKRPTFHYLDKGQMATIGKSRAVLQVGRLKMHGLFAWLAWLFVHVFYLVGFKNRIAVMFNWTWSYLFSKRGSRLITDKEWRLVKPSSN